MTLGCTESQKLVATLIQIAPGETYDPGNTVDTPIHVSVGVCQSDAGTHCCLTSTHIAVSGL